MDSGYYFLVVFWGEEYRRYFIDLALASLLSPGNIPALQNPDNSNRFLIATTDEDWAALQKEPLMKKMLEYIEPQHVPIPVPSETIGKMKAMSIGHKALVDIAFKDRARGIHLCPDVIYADRSIDYIQSLSPEKPAVVLTAAVRFEEEGVLSELRADGTLVKDTPVVLSSRKAVGVGLRSQHGEFMAADWRSPFFWNFPVYTWWTVPDETGIVMHTYSWSPILVDYSQMDNHFTDTFDDWTLDGDYIYKNFDKDWHRIKIVDDSDDVFLLPVTPRAEASPPQDPHWTKTAPFFRNATRGCLLDMVYNHNVMDPLKREIYFNPVRWHTQELNEKWKETEETVVRFLCKAISSPRSLEVLLELQRRRDREKEGANKNQDLPSALSNFITKFRYSCVKTVWFIERLPAFALRYLCFEPIRIAILLIAYAKIITLAIFGDQTERDRIRKRWKSLSGRV